MKTIRKNSIKKIRAIFAQAQVFKYYTLDNGFKGEMVQASEEHNERVMHDIFKGHAKIRSNDDQTFFEIDYHSNLWITFDFLPEEK